MGPELRRMQDDDSANPGMLWVFDDEALWQRKDGLAGKSCADCHGEAARSMRGVATRYPAFDQTLGRPIDLEGRINACRTSHQEGRASGIREQGPAVADRLCRPAVKGAADQRLPTKRQPSPSSPPAGRFSSSGRGSSTSLCAQCHDDNWGQKLGGATIPQGHPTGYPLYRLEWQSLGSLPRRLRNCLVGMRAVPYAYGMPEMTELELFLARRAQGLALETPAVRPY